MPKRLDLDTITPDPHGSVQDYLIQLGYEWNEAESMFVFDGTAPAISTAEVQRYSPPPEMKAYLQRILKTYAEAKQEASLFLNAYILGDECQAAPKPIRSRQQDTVIPPLYTRIRTTPHLGLRYLDPPSGQEKTMEQLNAWLKRIIRQKRED